MKDEWTLKKDGIKYRSVLDPKESYESVAKYHVDVEPFSVVTKIQNELRTDLDQAERRLGFSLPQSYKDFILAMAGRQLIDLPSEQRTDHIGFFLPSQIRRVKEADPLETSLAEEYPINSVDKEYFVYGIKQNSVAVRTNYYADALLIGNYISPERGSIYLYPQVHTLDGEMEAAMMGDVGDFRTPSFAELMRQLSVMELEQETRGHVAPYSQESLQGTCAEKLPLKDIWWK